MRSSLLATSLLEFLLALQPAVTAPQSDGAKKEPATTTQSDNQKKKAPVVQERVEEVIVTANRTETALSEVGSSTTVISGQEIREQQKATVLDVLRTVAGLDVVQSGSWGGTASVFLRGAKSEHTLVLMDGVELNDPISAGRPYDFAHLTTDNIDRIEIVRGPQSTLYGSDAIGGVINIITARGNGKPRAFVSTEAGHLHTYAERAGLSGGNRRVNYSLGMSRFDTSGISAANRKDGNQEKDGYENTSVSTRLGLTIKENWDADFILRSAHAKADIDNFGGSGGDDPNNKAQSEQLFVRAQTRLSLAHDRWEQKLGFSVGDHHRDYRNDPDVAHPVDLERGFYHGQILKLDWQNNLFLDESNIMTFGVETEEEKGESDYHSESAWGAYASAFAPETARTTGYYVQDEIRLRGSWFTTLGLRLDQHNIFGTKTTGRIASAYLLRRTGTTIKGSLGTGFKAPSLFQLYAPLYGEPRLEPEQSTGWDVGVEQTLISKKAAFGATCFGNRFRQLIEFDGTASKYLNVAEAQSRGLELFGSAFPADPLTVRISYTYTHTEDEATGDSLLRRPANKFTINTNYRFLKKGNANLGLVYVGKRDDNDFSTWPSSRVRMDDYTLANLAVSWDLTNRLTLYARVENLLGAVYEEVKGYGTPGIGVFAGIRVGL